MADWFSSIVSLPSYYATKQSIRDQTPVPNVNVCVYCVQTSSFFRWVLGDSHTDDDATYLTPSNSIDSAKGRWILSGTGGGGGSITLAGDASGASDANDVTHVTGTTNTKLEGTASVAMRVDGSDVLTASAASVSMLGATWTTGTAIPTASEPEGSLYIRTLAGSGSMYQRQNGAWVAIGATSTLGGDVIGPIAYSTVLNVTGTTNTVVAGASSVTMQVNNVDMIKADTTGAKISNQSETTAYVVVGTGAPSDMVATNGSIYLRTDGASSTTFYVKVSGSWLALSAGSGTLSGDATGSISSNTVVQITGGTNGCTILEPSANPTTAPASGKVLQFPSKTGAVDQWRWLQANGCAPVQYGYMGEGTANTSITIPIMQFNLADNSTTGNIQSFVGTLRVRMNPINTDLSTFCEWQVPFQAYTYYQGGVFTIKVDSILNYTDCYNYTAGYSSYLNSGFAWAGRYSSNVITLKPYGVPNSWYTQDSFAFSSWTPIGDNATGDFGISPSPLNYMGRVRIFDNSSGNNAIVSATITPPESTATVTAWSGSFRGKAWRSRVHLVGMWSLEPGRDTTTK